MVSPKSVSTAPVKGTGLRRYSPVSKGHQSSQILVAESGCMGQCSSGPTVRIMPDNTWYCRVQPEDVDTIVNQHLKAGPPGH